jgi:hypothetical protein
MQLGKDIVIDSDNKVHFKGILTPIELHTILTIGLNYLLSVGAIYEDKHSQDLKETNASPHPTVGH